MPKPKICQGVAPQSKYARNISGEQRGSLLAALQRPSLLVLGLQDYASLILGSSQIIVAAQAFLIMVASLEAYAVTKFKEPAYVVIGWAFCVAAGVSILGRALVFRFVLYSRSVVNAGKEWEKGCGVGLRSKMVARMRTWYSFSNKSAQVSVLQFYDYVATQLVLLAIVTNGILNWTATTAPLMAMGFSPVHKAAAEHFGITAQVCGFVSSTLAFTLYTVFNDYFFSPPYVPGEGVVAISSLKQGSHGHEFPRWEKDLVEVLGAVFRSHGYRAPRTLTGPQKRRGVRQWKDDKKALLETVSIESHGCNAEEAACPSASHSTRTYLNEGFTSPHRDAAIGYQFDGYEVSTGATTVTTGLLASHNRR